MKKILIGICIVAGLVIVASISYYFLSYLPKLNEKKFLLAQQEKCLEVGKTAYEADIRYYGADKLDEPQYGYNKKLNTCIYSNEYFDSGDLSKGQNTRGFFPYNCNANWERWVKNSYTNEKIISVMNYTDAQCQWVTSVDRINKFDTDSENLFDNEN